MTRTSRRAVGCVSLLSIFGVGCDGFYRVRGSVTAGGRPVAGVIAQVVRECNEPHEIGARSIIGISKADGQYEMTWIGAVVGHFGLAHFIVEFWKDGLESSCVDVRESDWRRCSDGRWCYPVYADLRESNAADAATK